ncbi:hypothetical protein J8281_19455, partial [Aquimarina sp. U1-2]
GITRYVSYGGIMRIREGAASNIVISDNNYLHVHISNGKTTKTIKKQLDFSPLSSNNFSIDTKFENIPVSITYNEFIADAIPQIEHNENEGKPMLEMIIS